MPRGVVDHQCTRCSKNIINTYKPYTYLYVYMYRVLIYTHIIWIGDSQLGRCSRVARLFNAKHYTYIYRILLCCKKKKIKPQ